MLAKVSHQSKLAIFNHAWTLPEDIRKECHIFSLRKTTVAKLLNSLDTEHSYLDYLTFNGTKFRLNYVNGSTPYLEYLESFEKGATPVLLSFRASKKANVFCCLVMINPESLKDTNNTVMEF